MFELTKRQGLIVHINNKHVLRRLRHYGHIMYVSKRLHYVVLYVNQTSVAKIQMELEQLHNVTEVERSQWPNIDPTVFRLVNAENDQKKNEDD